MNTTTKIVVVGMLLAGLAKAFGQPVITNQPQNQTVIAGETATFSVGATGAPPLSYQWRSHANASSYTDISFGTEATLVLTNVQPTSRRFAVVVTDSVGLSATSSPLAQLTVVFPPSITQQPASQFAEVGDPVAIRVTATGTPPLSYQWLFNSQALSGRTLSNLTWTSVQLSNAGGYSVVVTDSRSSTTSGVATLTVAPATFTQITNGAIVTDGGHSIGCAWGDYDNDGFVDLFVTNADGQRNFLYHNNRNGTFSRITTGSIANDTGDWRACPWVDYDNDGFLDMLVTSTDANGFPSRNILYHNNGDGSFSSLPSQNVGALVPGGGGTEGAVWADYDNDGALDLFVARYGIDWVFHNNGFGFFTSITNNLIGTASEDSYYGNWADYNNDGLPDLFVTVKSDPPTNRLYLNLGGGSFEQIRSGSIATDSAYSVGSAWGDYDNDGFLDLCVANGFSGPLLQTNYLYRNNGDGTFTRMTSNMVGSLVSDAGFAVTPCWGDYDNDGYLDLFVTRRIGGASAGNTNLLYHNNGDGTFSRVMSGRIPVGNGESIGAAWGDYDNDGFLDLFVAKGAHGTENNYLYHNNSNVNGWIKIKLVGTLSNRSAIGAKVRLKANIRGRTLWQFREITVGNGFNQSPLDAHFGLGNATNIETIRIEWPSGTVQELHNINPRQFLTMTEPPGLQAMGVPTDNSFQLRLTGWAGMSFAIDTSSNVTDWTPWRLVIATNRTTRIDTPGLQESSRFYRALPAN